MLQMHGLYNESQEGGSRAVVETDGSWEAASWEAANMQAQAQNLCKE
jgi:hypothetical protein